MGIFDFKQKINNLAIKLIDGRESIRFAVRDSGEGAFLVAYIPALAQYSLEDRQTAE